MDISSRKIEGCEYMLHHTRTADPDPSDIVYRSHSHNMLEMYYFIEGKADFAVGEKLLALRPGTLLLIPVGVTHNLRLREEEQIYDRIALHFHDALIPESWREAVSERGREALVFYLGERKRIWFEESISLLLDRPELLSEHVLAQSVLCQLLSGTWGEGIDNTERLEIRDPESPALKLTSGIVSYIKDHLAEDLTLDSLSEQFFLDKSHLNRQFKKVMGCTIWEYILRERVFSARQRIIQTGDIKGSAAASGFCDYSAFYRNYCRLIGRSPKEDLSLYLKSQK